jgi:hypothetical protein
MTSTGGSMNISKSVFDALKSILTIESRLETLAKSVEAVSEKIETHAARISARLEEHGQRLARLEGKFELIENTLSSRRRRLPEGGRE